MAGIPRVAARLLDYNHAVSELAVELAVTVR
jgi:hypothetical protein